ncbi:MAG TPA: DoxX family protein [bacterium]|nr:DoxX family protein [bacterium]
MGIQERLDDWADHHRGFFFDLVRIYLGIGLFVKGIYFIKNPDYLTHLIDESENLWFLPAAAAHYVIVAHLVGGLLIAIGFLTRIAALVQIPILIGAVFYVNMPKMITIEPRQNFEFSALVLFLLVLIAVRGGGPLSLDARIFAREPRMVKV